MRGKLKGLGEALNRERNGITGLETSIILIAFVVVASIFAYTVLASGVFSSQKAKEAVNQGVATAGHTMEILGSIAAMGSPSTNQINTVIFTVSNALAGAQIDLTNPIDVAAGGNGTADYIPDSTSSHVTVVSFHSKREAVLDLMYTATEKGFGDGDQIMETGEKFEIAVDLRGLSSPLVPYETFSLELKPQTGALTRIQKTLPSDLGRVFFLN